MIETKLIIRETDYTRILDLLNRIMPDVIVWAYGSRVTGEAHAASDLDLVLRSKNLAPIEERKILELKESLRESTIPILVDVRDWTKLPSSFHEEILRNHFIFKK